MEEGGANGGVVNGSGKVTGSEARALIVAAAQATQQESTLQKLRQHFQRVRPLTSRSVCLCQYTSL